MLLTPTELERLTIFTAAELARQAARARLPAEPSGSDRPHHRRDPRGRARRPLGGRADEPGLHHPVRRRRHAGRAGDDPDPAGRGRVPRWHQAGDRARAGSAARGRRCRPARTRAQLVIGDEAGEIEINAGRRRVMLEAVNTGDRPVQIGSHYHFFEVNRAMQFDRAPAFGMHLDIPAGTAVRFEPGQAKQVTLVAYGGQRRGDRLPRPERGPARRRRPRCGAGAGPRGRLPGRLTMRMSRRHYAELYGPTVGDGVPPR